MNIRGIVLWASCVLLLVVGILFVKVHFLEERVVTPVVLTAPLSLGQEFTSVEAGIPDSDRPQTLANIKMIEEKDGKVFVTLDPVHFTDCFIPLDSKLTLPKECKTKGDIGSYVFENKDKTTQTYEMMASSGPYLVNEITNEATEKLWRTMDVATMRSILMDHRSATSYYAPNVGDEMNLFYYVVEKGKIKKLYQRYFE